MSDDIDWENAPAGATHYQKAEGDYLEGWLRGDSNYAVFMPTGCSEWKPCSYVEPNAIPRPAKHRDWSDPAMWFDAPDWARCVGIAPDEKYYYLPDSKPEKDQWTENGNAVAPEVTVIPEVGVHGTLEQMLEGVKHGMFAEEPDNVNHPNHYTQGGVECIDAIESATVNKQGIEAVCTANVIKYLWRYENKNGVEDVRKAQWYLNRLLTHLS